MTKRGMALLTAVLMLWVAAIPAFAADVPYPDVSADHWAYEAIASLHNAGLVEGYPDGTFGGERTFTRYEMAMVFSRILQRLDGRMDLLAGTGIDVDALMDEFGSELDLINALTVAIANAQRTADTAADRAYRARLAAVEALAQVQEVEHTATMALALAQEGAGSDDARTAAQRAQRVAADAEAAALRATAIAETAFTAAKNAEEAAGRARTTGDAEGALAQVERVTNLVMQADRLAYLAQLSADRALELAESANARLDELVLLGGEVKAVYTTGDPDGSLNVHVDVKATAHVTNDVTVEAGVGLTENILDVAAIGVLNSTQYAKVMTPGFLREVAFNRSSVDHELSLTVGLPLGALDAEVKGALGHGGLTPTQYYSVGIGLNDIALTDTITLNAGFTHKSWENVPDAEMSFGLGAGLDMLGGHVDLGFDYVVDGDYALNGGFTYPFNDAVDGTLSGTYTENATTASVGLGVKF